MVKLFCSSKYRVLFLVLLIYLIPLLLLSSYSLYLSLLQVSWELFGIGLALSCFGSSFLFSLLMGWERELSLKKMDHLVSHVALFPQGDVSELNQEKIQGERQEALQEKLLESQTEIRLLEEEKRVFQQQLERISQEFALYKSGCQQSLEEKNSLLEDFQQTISEQRATIVKKQQQVAQLEGKVRDLTYEIKTLLQLAELGSQQKVEEPTISFSPHEEEKKDVKEVESIEPLLAIDKQVSNPQEALSQLKRCIDIAQKMTGVAHFANGTSRLRDLPVNNYTVDLRRLLDSLRSECLSTILLYSQKEGRLLFVNSHGKQLLGWSSDKFVQHFQDIFQSSIEEWNRAMGQLAYKNEVQVALTLKSRSGEEVLVQCHLGLIPTGIFRNHVIGILYFGS